MVRLEELIQVCGMMVMCYTNGSGLGLSPTSSLSMKMAVVVHSHTNGTLMVRVNGYSQVKEW